MYGNQTKVNPPTPNLWVSEAFEQRRMRNAKYSLRSFARDLGMNVSHLSQFLMGHEGISIEKAHSIAKKLKWSSVKTQQFLALVQMHFGRSLRQKSQGQVQWDTLSNLPNYDVIKKDQFALISNWYHMAILELAELSDFNSNPQWISKKLGISVLKTEEAVAGLERLGLIQFVDNVNWKPTSTNTSTEDDVPSWAVQSFHKQVSDIFQKKISQENIHQREVQSFIFSVAKNKLPALKEKLRLLCEEFISDVDSNDSKDELYAFSVQLFSLLNPTIENTIHGEPTKKSRKIRNL